MAVSQDLREEYNPPKGNKLTSNTTHPVAIIVTIFLTIFPIIFSLISLFVSNAVPLLLVQLAGIAILYYHMKNFAGRFLGRLRWHTYIVEGKTYFYYENLPLADRSTLDNWVFWSCLWFSVLFNILRVVLNVLGFDLLATFIAIIGFVAGIGNLAPYIKCSREAKKAI